MKKYIIQALTFCVVLCGVSCKKFIKEELVSTLTFDHYETDAGLEDLVRSAYAPVRWKFNNEQGYALFNFGDDEFILGDQFNREHYNRYNQVLNANESFLNELWTNNYDGINRCNIGIEKIGAFSDGASKLLGTYTLRTQRIGELRFLRAYYYFMMVQQFGAIPLVQTSSLEIRTDFKRDPVADIYKAIIADLQYAKNTLAPTTAQMGRATKGAAQHFLAKVYLTRGSAVTDQRGQQATDMDSAAYYADQVIAGPFILEPDYMNLFMGVYPAGYPNVATPAIGVDGAAPSGDYSRLQASNNSKEVIFAAQFKNDLVYNGSSGNRMHEYFIMQYDLAINGLTRNADNFNGRPFRRLGPSDYAIDLFDRKNDSRFYKSFRTVYYGNTIPSPDSRPKFTTADAPNPSLVGKVKTGVGDTAALFIVNNRSNPILSADIARFRYQVWARYFRATPTAPIQEGFTNSKYLTLVKHLDPVRVTNNFNEEVGVKNGILARLGETYLIAAEAYGRKGDYTKALTYINKLRDRAAYRAGEFKNPQTWMFDGGTKGDVASTAPAMQATTALFTTNAPSENYPPTVTTTADRFIHFILNERTRELCGELYRWEDLVRTETLFLRAKLFNKDATSIAAYHKLRPIPQFQIDLTTVDGKPMTSDQKKSYQNPGY
ncbi:RagB/SusD family nutrient uptake outer membrane protein [Hufsiella ginkgonis]|uniref:RagB/SusD family nutrient uptake outer membrane protein n=1 Tax=Hufsiella ginkgonis TaxID=2695274 RepID=A0A7K1Y252_9SPHI|nr:RagB/SusD family nutrient uptake outer membrane protein [Hufsiella ginkgonis]MXV17344.1 RagB/SusD family nutrient uptake outer membrane protein [Hufsiella ginkgonis]